MIDTSVLFPHNRGPPYKIGLRVLSRMHLNKMIQNNLDHGHSPIEDANACADLVKLYILNGLLL